MEPITEDFCSYEVAKLLKEKGFDEPIQHFYKFDSKKLYRGTVFTNTQIGDKFYNAPTHQMAIKWLREVHKICIVVYPFTHREGGTYTSDICTLTMTMEEGHLRGVWNSYEEAVEATLKYSLKNLI